VAVAEFYLDLIYVEPSPRHSGRPDRQVVIADRQRRSSVPPAERRLAFMEIIDIHMSIKGAIDDAIARAVAVGGLVAIALIHILQLPDAFDAIGYLGAMFIAAVVGSLLLAAVMTRTSDDLTWIATGGLAAVILLGYVLSRSVGLPGFTDDVGEWGEAPGLASMVIEGLLVFLGTAVLLTRRHPMRSVARSAAPTGRAAPGTRHGPAVG
jgi:hypothetical protein